MMSHNDVIIFLLSFSSILFLLFLYIGIIIAFKNYFFFLCHFFVCFVFFVPCFFCLLFLQRWHSVSLIVVTAPTRPAATSSSRLSFHTVFVSSTLNSILQQCCDLTFLLFLIFFFTASVLLVASL